MSNYKERLVCRLVINRLLGKYHCNIEDLLTGKYCVLGRGVKKQIKRMLQEGRKSIDFTDTNKGGRG